VRISHAEAQGLLAPTCRVKIEVSGGHTLAAQCMSYDALKDQFFFNLKLAKSSMGMATAKVIVSYPPFSTTTTKSVMFEIKK